MERVVAITRCDYTFNVWDCNAYDGYQRHIINDDCIREWYVIARRTTQGWLVLTDTPSPQAYAFECRPDGLWHKLRTNRWQEVAATTVMLELFGNAYLDGYRYVRFDEESA